VVPLAAGTAIPWVRVVTAAGGYIAHVKHVRVVAQPLY
jgi:hypothetical protein